MLSPETQPSLLGSRKLTARPLPCSPEAGRGLLMFLIPGQEDGPAHTTLRAAPGEAPGPLSSEAHPPPTHASRQLFSSPARQPSITSFLRKAYNLGEKELEET